MCMQKPNPLLQTMAIWSTNLRRSPWWNQYPEAHLIIFLQNQKCCPQKMWHVIAATATNLVIGPNWKWGHISWISHEIHYLCYYFGWHLQKKAEKSPCLNEGPEAFSCYGCFSFLLSSHNEIRMVYAPYLWSLFSIKFLGYDTLCDWMLSHCL